MATIVLGRIPATDFALEETFERVSDLEIECERVVANAERSAMPLLWARTSDHASLEEAFEADPSVEKPTLLAEYPGEWLYRMNWIDSVHLLIQILTNSNATILNAVGQAGEWRVRVFYPDRDELSRTHDFCEQHGFTFTIEMIRELDSEPAGRHGLTDEQYRALTLACEQGYFKVPREISLDELADDLDISHQALSERLRRGHEALVQDMLAVGTPSQTSLQL